MEDESQALDDFFSKKDRSKKGKSKGKKLAKAKENDTKQKSSGGTSQKKEHEIEDEWNDYDVPPEKDYSGLKIQALQIVSDEQKEKEETGDKEDGEGEDDPLSRDVSSGPWQKGGSQPTQQVQQVEEVNAPAAAAAAAPPRKYVPPGALASKRLGPRQRPGQPPDIGSEALFPTLGVSAGVNKRSEKETRDFEVVTKGTRSQDSRMDSSTAQLDLGNRYDSLRR